MPCLPHQGALLLALLTSWACALEVTARRQQTPLPFCRKSSLLAVVPAAAADAPIPTTNGTPGSAMGGAQPRQGQHLLAWSGQGLHKSIFDDLFSFDLAARQWECLEAGCDENAGCPTPRWKAGAAQAVQGGMVVVGGDLYRPGTKKHKYSNDIWLLGWPSLDWSQAQVDPTAPAPAPRRGHSTARYVDAAGVEHIVLFGGRTFDKVLLNDCWDVQLTWPNATWRQVTPPTATAAGPPPLPPTSHLTRSRSSAAAQAAEAAQAGLEAAVPGSRLDDVAGEAQAPAPRRGHIAVMVPDAASPTMVIHGGRSDWDYFGDTWELDISAGRWSKIEVVGNNTCPPRDHHAAALYNGSLIVWGGRAGSTYCESQPMNDLWALELSTKKWRQVEQAAPVPLPRFEEGVAHYSPQGPQSTDQRLAIFGGQTFRCGRMCQLNDAWELHLSNLTWAQLSPPRLCTRKCRRIVAGAAEVPAE